MIEVKIKGGFNDGLTATQVNQVLMFSEVKKKWFKPDLIIVYDRYGKPQISIKHSIGILNTKYNIIDQADSISNTITLIKNGVIEFANGQKILFKRKTFNLITNPYSEILFENKKIGYVNNKKLKLFELDFTLFLEETYENLLDLILTYILIAESNNDRYGED